MSNNTNFRWFIWALLWLCIFTQTHASGINESILYSIPGIDTSVIDKFMTPGFDYSIRILNDIVGTLGDVASLADRVSPYAEVTKNLVNYFTQGMFSIAVVIFSYTIIMGTIYTASEGEIMGRKMQTYFVLFRSFVAMGLYLPLQSGYSILQSLITNVVITSVMVTNLAWYMVVTVMVTMLNGPASIQLLSNVNSEFSFSQAVSSAETQITAFINKTTGDYLEADKTSELASQAYTMGHLAQMICTYNNYYLAKGNSGIDEAYSAIQGAIYCEGQSGCPFPIATDETSVALTLPLPGSGSQTDCKTINFSTNSDYNDSAKAMIQTYLASLSGYAKSYFTSYKDNSKDISATNTQIGEGLAAGITDMVSSYLLSQITTYNAEAASQSTGNTTQQDWIDKLVDGGWAMAANNYFYYAFKLFSAADSLQQTSDYSTYLYATPTKYEGQFDFCTGDFSNICDYLLTGSSDLGGKVFCQLNPTSADCGGSGSTETTSVGSMADCAADISQCANISNYLMANDDSSGTTVVTAKDFVTIFYKGWKTQISNINEVKSFAEIEAQTKLCNLPFAASALNECTSSDTFLEPSEAPTFFAAALGTAVTFFLVAPKVFWIPTMVLFEAYFAGIAYYQNYADIYTIWTDPSKLYPDTLALGLQSFTYFTVKAWFDTFANGQAMVFVFPIQAMSAFGYRILLYCVAFIFNVGTATFSANLTMTISMFFRQVLIDAAISFTQMSAAIPQEYGWWWVYSIIDEPGVIVSWLDMEMNTNLGLICPYPLIIWVLFVPIPVFLIVGLAWIGFGYVVNAITLAATMLDILDVSQIVLEINSFIISRWNPIYFAIATPLISLATLFAFFLPLYPIMVYTLTVITWATQYIETLLAMPIILLGMANPEGHSPLLGKAEKMIMLLLLLFMRPLTTLIGFVMATFITSISSFLFYQMVIPIIDVQIGQWAKGYTTMVLGGSAQVTQVLDTNNVTIQAVMTMLLLIMFTMVFYYMILNAYSLIYKLPNSISAWIGVNMTNTEEEAIIQQISGEINNITGSLTGAATSIAGKQGEATSPGGGLDVHKQYESGKQGYKKDEVEGEQRGASANMFSSGKGREEGVAR